MRYARSFDFSVWVSMALISGCLSACGTKEHPKGFENSVTKPALDEERIQLAFEEGSKVAIFSQRTPTGKITLTLDNAPPYLHALEMAPEKREERLNAGNWLVIAFATYSVPDIECVVKAIQARGKLTTNLQVGLRPFRDYDEVKSWYKGYESVESPFWVIFREGKILGENQGVMSEAEITNFIQESLKK